MAGAEPPGVDAGTTPQTPAVMLPKAPGSQPPSVDTWAMEPQIAALLDRLDIAVRESPGDPGAWLEYGESLQAHGLVEAAARCYRETAALVPTTGAASLTAHYLLAHALRPTAPDEALPALEAALSGHPGYLAAWVLLGEIREELGDREGAARAFEQALETDPESGLALYRLGLLRLAAGDPEKAIPLLDRALATEPGAGAVRSALAQAWNAAGDRKRANEVLGPGGPVGGLPGIEDPIHFRMTERDISSPRLLERARAASEAGNLAEAENWYRDLTRIRPRDAVVLAEFGAILDRRGRPEEAEPRYLDAIALDPELGLARFGLGTLRVRRRDLAGAEFQFRLALASREDDPRVNTALGDVLLRQRRFAAALAFLESAAGFDPEDGRPRVLAAAALAELGRYDEAWDAVREARRLGSEPPAEFLEALRARRPEPGR